MTLHIFNPDHDLALASGLANFTAPHAGRQLRHDLGWLPALWAESDDAVMTDDVMQSQRAARCRPVGTRLFTDKRQVATLPVTAIEPWGWNSALCSQLLRAGINSHLLPTDETLQAIRMLSHRRQAALMLARLQSAETTGEAVECTTIDDAIGQAHQYGRAVMKAPWSSSGRGIRFVDINNCDTFGSGLDGWIRNTISRQGSVMVEPFYHKIKDFGMEFLSDGHGNLQYQGLSLFHTQNGAYAGNIIATEESKRQQLARYIPIDLLDHIRNKLCSELDMLLNGCYCGPLGVDMMIVGKEAALSSCLLHPCVEINLRRTMGHVALAIGQKLNPPKDDDMRHVMRITFTGNNYKLQIKRL